MRKLNLLLLLARVFRVSLFARRKVNGRVTAPDGSVLPGVTVRLKGGRLATQTDKDGQFRLAIPPGTVLIFNHRGYAGQEIAAGKQACVRVQMQLAGQTQGNVVVINYSTQKTWDLTGSIASPHTVVVRN